MVTLDVGTLTVPVGIVRLLELLFTCVSFSLVASVGDLSIFSFWTWSMFTWCFCFCITLLILGLEFFSLHTKIPISWNDFTSAFSMLATLMMLAASIVYPKYFACSSCGRPIGATVTSWVAFVLYAAEVGLTRAKPGEVSGFLSTVPGLLKVLEAFVACIIFTCLAPYKITLPGLQWCIAVYAICFIVAALFIVLTIGRLLALFPAPFGKVLTCCNVLAVMMYATAVVIWPYYWFKGNSSPGDLVVVVAVMTGINLVAYIVDSVYSVKLSFFVRPA